MDIGDAFDFGYYGPVSSWRNRHIVRALCEMRRAKAKIGEYETEVIAEAEARIPTLERTVVLFGAGTLWGLIVYAAIDWVL